MIMPPAVSKSSARSKYVAHGGFVFPTIETEPLKLMLKQKTGAFKLVNDPFAGKMTWNLRLNSENN
jgi:hypothetical protein